MKILRIKLSEDKLSAYLTVFADSNHFPDYNEISSFLVNEGIIFGIDNDKLSEIVAAKEPIASVLVAKGIPAIGRFKWHINADNPNKPTITYSDRADFKQLLSYHFVKKNDKILSLIDESEIQAGETVTGLKIEPPADEFELPSCKNIRLSDDKKSLIADADGYLIWDDDILTISSVFHVKGDVGYNTGNLKVKGPVVIDGDVRSGFRVETDSSIYIGGTVDAANLYAQNGDITIEHGILGQGRAKILCGGSLKCGFMQDANIAVKNDVLIQRYAINCFITASRVINNLSEKAVIRGGSISAESGIFVNTVGSERSVPTELKIQSYSEGENQSRLWKVSKERTSLKVRLSSLQKRKNFLLVLKNKVNRFSKEKQDEIEFIATEMKRLNDKLSVLENEELNLQQESSRENIKKEVQIQGTLYRNVRIIIGDCEYFSDSEVKGVRIYKIKDQILIESLKGVPADEIYVPDN